MRQTFFLGQGNTRPGKYCNRIGLKLDGELKGDEAWIGVKSCSFIDDFIKFQSEISQGHERLR